MSLLGSAALMMWGIFPAEMRAEEGMWHSKEHMPERLGCPGFLRARRALSDVASETSVFMMYELETLSSATSRYYQERLNAPTPWTTKINKSSTRFSRVAVSVVSSWSEGIGGAVLTIRCAARPGSDGALRDWAVEQVERARTIPSLVGAHFLMHNPDADISSNEHRLRCPPDDPVSAVLVLEAFDAPLLRDLHAEQFSVAALHEAGAAAGIEAAHYRLVHVRGQ